MYRRRAARDGLNAANAEPRPLGRQTISSSLTETKARLFHRSFSRRGASLPSRLRTRCHFYFQDEERRTDDFTYDVRLRSNSIHAAFGTISICPVWRIYSRSNNPPLLPPCTFPLSGVSVPPPADRPFVALVLAARVVIRVFRTRRVSANDPAGLTVVDSFLWPISRTAWSVTRGREPTILPFYQARCEVNCSAARRRCIRQRRH